MTTQAALTVRELASQDKAAWLPLWKGYQTFYKTNIADEVTDNTWQRFLDPAEPMWALGAFTSEGELIGIVHCIYHRSCWTAGDYCYLQDLFTKEGARNQGIGRTLIEAVYARAKAEGASRVHWLTQETNAVGMVLYNKVADRSGFLQYRKIL
jgi:GNAT superfamily N-acetyltransferase